MLEDQSRPTSRRMSTVSHPHDIDENNQAVHEASKVHFSDENFTMKNPSDENNDFDSQTKF